MELTPRQHLVDLVGHPERVQEVPPEALPSILLELAAIHSALAARIVGSSRMTPQDTSTDLDRLVDVTKASEMLGVSADFLYTSPAVRSLRVRVGSRVMFSQRKIQDYIRRRAGQ
jgi:hypothetical protein